MSYYADLGHECQIGWGPDMRAVGWLERDHPFTTGTVEPLFLERLKEHLETGYNPYGVGGSHVCEFCPPAEPVPTAEAPEQPQESTGVIGSALRRAIAAVSSLLPGWRRRAPDPLPPQPSHCLPCGGELAEDELYCGRCGAAATSFPWLEAEGVRGAIGFRNLYIPTAETVYVVPEMILHYVLAHGYRPPEEFVEAVLACPAQGSPEFFAMVDRFRASFDGMFFDRDAWAHREWTAWGACLWTFRGICPVCRKIVYSYEERVPVHCEQPAIHVARREG